MYKPRLVMREVTPLGCFPWILACVVQVLQQCVVSVHGIVRDSVV